MSNISNLKDYLVLRANELADDLEKLECLALIDDWYASRLAAAALQSQTLLSYTIAGRSVTRNQAQNIASQEHQLYARITALLYKRGSGLADMRVPSDTGGVTW